MGKDQFGSGDKSRKIPAKKIKKSQQGGSHKKEGFLSKLFGKKKGK